MIAFYREGAEAASPGGNVATIVDVARAAGVSTVTVSRVINEAPNVNAATRERVEQAVRHLGYVPNVAARSLRSKRTHSLALIVPDITNAFWTTISRGVEDAAQSQGYSVLLCNTDEDLVKQQRYLDVIVSRRVDGVIMAPCDADAGKLAPLRDHRIATVLIDRRIVGWDVDMVYGDSLSGAYALTSHLIGLGHRRIAMLSGPEGAPTAEDRIVGYRRALAEAGIAADPGLIRRGGFNWRAGDELTNQLWREGNAPTAVFAANNAIAIGVIGALGKMGLRIPQDVALVCFDDFPHAVRFFPFLTVIAQPAYDMGANAAQLLLSRLESPAALKPRRVVLPVRMVVRYSCGITLKESGHSALSLPLPDLAPARELLVRPLAPEEADAAAGLEIGRAADGRRRHGRRSAPTATDKPDSNRLRQVFNFREADRIPRVELRLRGRNVFEYVLERSLKSESAGGRSGAFEASPELQVELAQHIGLDAVGCELAWHADTWADDAVVSVTDLARLEPAPLAWQLGQLERYLAAAQAAGVGVFASFSGCFANALRSLNGRGAADLPLLERVMDLLTAHGERLVRAVCDRFGDDLAFVLIADDVADNQGLLLAPELFAQLAPGRLQRLIAPVLEHGVPAALHSGGRVADALPFMQQAGFRAIHGLDPACNDLSALHAAWAGKLVLMGGISQALLVEGPRERIETTIAGVCRRLAGQGGYVLGSPQGISDAIPPAHFVAMIEAARSRS